MTEFKVGELAESVGLTVRTLHHYDQIGLLTPSARNAAGHRLYGDEDVRRLYRICLLRRIGLPLVDIGRALDDADWDLERAMTEHLRLVDHRLTIGGQLRHRLTAMVAALRDGTPLGTKEFVETMEEMIMLDSPVKQRIALLVYEDIAAVHEYLVRVFGLGAGKLEYDSDGTCVHGEVHAGDGDIWLHRVSPEFGLASPKTLGAATATTAVMVEDVDAHYTRAKASGADIVYEPTDQAYGMREYSARDPEGGLWSFMQPLD